MSSPTEQVLTVEGQAAYAQGADGQPQNVEPTAPTTGHALQADESEDTDADSALGESINGSYSTSLAPSVADYVYENGRRYHRYREGQYPLPNDEIEQERLDMVHHIYLMLAGGALFRAPIIKSRPPRRILDLGTGTGIWAIEMAEEFPNSVIVGTDLSPIQPGWVPPNCKFYVDDFESDWEYRPDEHFDYIHGRALCGSVADWPRFFDQAYHSLNSGGWLEMQEYQTWLFSDDNTMKDAVWIKEWSEGTDEASTRFGKRLRTAQNVKEWMGQAGFLDVHEEIYKAPIGTWPKDKKFKQLGKFYRAALLDSLEPFALALYTRVHRYSQEELQVLIAGVRRELCDPKMHMYVPFHFVYGRKP